MLHITPKQSAARHSFHAPMLLYVGSGDKANLSFFFLHVRMISISLIYLCQLDALLLINNFLTR